MSSGASRAVYRPVVLNRALGALGLLVAALGLRSALDDPAWLLLALGGVVLSGNLWRAAVLTPTVLTIQGRFTRRSLRLSDVVRCGISTRGVPWVQTRDGAVAVEARMVSENYPRHQGPQVFVDDVRSRAAAAGADVEPVPGERVDAPVPTTKVFSW